MKFLGYKSETDMIIISLDISEKLPNKIMIICNDFSKTYDIRKEIKK